MGTVSFRVLGPVAMEVDGRQVALGGVKPRAMLAALLVRPDRTVDTPALIDVVWGDDPPGSARGMIQTYVSTLRRAIREAGAPDLLHGNGTGYRIHLSGRLDLTDFENAVADARDLLAQNRPEKAAEKLRRALKLWRGPAFDGVTRGLLRAEAERLTELRLSAVELRVAADLAMGAGEDLVPELHGLVAQHPYRERLWASLMLALHQTGQQSAALSVFESVRRRLADEFGTDPGPWLRDAHQKVLRDQPPQARPPAPMVPMQLPADLQSFCGRTQDLAELDRLLAETVTRTVVIVGPGGVGKTALAVHWAHGVRDRFPDGQLFVDLRGYDRLAPVSTAQALSQCLRSLGTPAPSVPATVDEQIAMYRSLLADRRMLVVLDNAAGTEQVRALLPPNPQSLALVTSRDDMRGLTVLTDARAVRLGVLSEAESLDLLTTVLGTDMADGEPVRDLARLCGHLPLALRIVAANLLGGGHSSIEHHVAALREDRLSELAIEGDQSVAVRATFQLSYQALDEPTRRLFRLLGRVPGADLTLPVACAVTGDGPAGEVRRSLDRLVAANLLLSLPDDRYKFHDLIREFAADRARADDAGDLVACDRRVFEYYLWAATEAMAMLYPVDRDSSGSRFDSAQAAGRWLDDERTNLVAVVRHSAGNTQFCHYGSQIAQVLQDYFHNQGHSADGLAICDSVLEAVRNAGDQRSEVAIRTMSGLIHYNLSLYDQAIAQHSRAREVARVIGDQVAEAEALHQIGRVYAQLGKPRDAMRCHEAELRIADEVDSDRLRARAYNYIGVAHLSLGDIDGALRRHNQSLEAGRDLGDPDAIIRSLNGLGLVHWTAGQLVKAAEYHEQCVQIAKEAAFRYGFGSALVCMAETCCDLGWYDKASSYAAQALELSREVGERRHEAGALEIEATVSRKRGRYAESIEQYTVALDLSRAISFRYGEVSILIGLSAAYRALGGHSTAIGYARQALDTMYETSMRVLEGAALTELAAGHLGSGDVTQAVHHAENALKVAGDGGQKLVEARALHVRGHVALAVDGRDAALPYWRRSWELFAETGAPETAEVRALIEAEHG